MWNRLGLFLARIRSEIRSMQPTGSGVQHGASTHRVVESALARYRAESSMESMTGDEIGPGTHEDASGVSINEQGIPSYTYRGDRAL
jgi:hypothetical protein